MARPDSVDGHGKSSPEGMRRRRLENGAAAPGRAAGHKPGDEHPGEIALYIFDIGGVVSFDGASERRAARILGIPLRELYTRSEPEFQELTTGGITPEEFWRKVSRKIGRPIEEELFAACFRPRLNRPVARLVRRLRRVARVVAGTNTVEPHYRIHQDRGDYDIFDAVYASCRMGLAKPDPAFFCHILEREGRQAEQSLFVDDREENVHAAAGLGMSALLFTSARRLERELGPRVG